MDYRFLKIGAEDKQGNASALRINDKRLTVSGDKPFQVLHSNTSENSFGETLDVTGIGSVHLQVTGEFEARVVIQGSMDGETFYNLHTIDKGNGHSVDPITKQGQYIVDVRGYEHFRSITNQYKSGSVTVLAKGESFDSFTPYSLPPETTQIVKNRKIDTLYNERISTPADTRFTTDVIDVSSFDYYHIYIIGIIFDPLGGKFDIVEVPHVEGEPVTSRVNRELGVGLDNIVLMKNISSVTPEISLRITPTVDMEATLIVIGGVHNG